MVLINRKLDAEREAELEPSQLIWDMGIPKGILSIVPNTHLANQLKKTNNLSKKKLKNIWS